MLKTFFCKDTCTAMLTAALFTAAKTWKRPRCPSVGDWVRRPRGRHTADCHSAVRQDEALPVATTWMDLERIMLSEMSQMGKAEGRVVHSRVGGKTEGET